MNKITARTLALKFAGKENRWVRVPSIPDPSCPADYAGLVIAYAIFLTVNYIIFVVLRLSEWQAGRRVETQVDRCRHYCWRSNRSCPWWRATEPIKSGCAW